MGEESEMVVWRCPECGYATFTPVPANHMKLDGSYRYCQKPMERIPVLPLTLVDPLVKALDEIDGILNEVDEIIIPGRGPSNP